MGIVWPENWHQRKGRAASKDPMDHTKVNPHLITTCRQCICRDHRPSAGGRTLNIPSRVRTKIKGGSLLVRTPKVDLAQVQEQRTQIPQE